MPHTAKTGEGVVGRMAPTPSSYLHIGNIFACLVAWLYARQQGGKVILRIEDLDRDRCKPEYIDAVLHDLETLGLTWDNADIVYQSQRTDAYDRAFESLEDAGILYPCFCSRADLHAASAPHRGERYLYAGTCRHLSDGDRAEKAKSRPPAYRVHVPHASFGTDDILQGRFEQELDDECGDFIVKRSDGIYAYQLAVVVDDLAQGVNQVVRGIDLLDSTPQQIYLRSILNPAAQQVTYAHIPLLLDKDGRRLAKRDRDMGLPAILTRFKGVEHLLGHLAKLTGIRPDDEPLSAQELIAHSSLDALAGRKSITWRLPGE